MIPSPSEGKSPISNLGVEERQSGSQAGPPADWSREGSASTLTEAWNWQWIWALAQARASLWEEEKRASEELLTSQMLSQTPYHTEKTNTEVAVVRDQRIQNPKRNHYTQKYTIGSRGRREERRAEAMSPTSSGN